MANEEKEVKTELLHCSFCGKSQDEVTIIIAGSPTVTQAYICNKCVAICNNIIAEWMEKRAGA